LFFRLANGILRDAAAAEDACQQAMLKAWAQRDRIDNPETLRAWLARTVVNESLQIARRIKVERRVVGRHAIDSDTATSGSEDLLAGREAVIQAMQQLDEEVRAVIVLRVIEGLSGNEVKELLGCSAAGVSRRLHQGLEQLRTALKDESKPVRVSP
jgi:RNA polymerase sigma factor (sigma-70 family)